mmetsp:Transcript_16733/g.18959  ORF Transcript_16733/g.18959 Transcript_16733/m.18959 type:complete len:692 (+) Transcript_16733:108-2183(+)
MPSERISTLLGAPPNAWKKLEQQQVKQIHRCYRNAFNAVVFDESAPDIAELAKGDGFSVLFNNDNDKNKRAPGTHLLTRNQMDQHNNANTSSGGGADGDANEEIDINDNGDEKRDEEYFLPKDSPLRSKDGDRKRPANATFKDYETFQKSCEFDFWREHYESQSQDRFLSEVAETIVSNICLSQSRKELRVRHGSVPGGRWLRAKREHITPLALCMHEIKLWATNILRTSSIYEEDTYLDLKARIAYIEGLAMKEVWGDPASFVAAGMRPVAHDKLFRLLLNTKEALNRAYEYAYRGYCRRSSREKLARLGNLLKNVVLREIKILSALMTVKERLIDPKTHRIQPTDLLNKIQNQAFVEYRNIVNVCMYQLCQKPLVRAALTSDYEGKEVQESLSELAKWTEENLFCAPGSNGDPEYKLDEGEGKGLLPEVYVYTAEHLKEMLKAVDPHAKLPLAPKKHIKILKKAFGSLEEVEIVMKLVMKVAASIQELIPALYAGHVLWGIAGDGGDFTVYDTLREQVIRVMSNTIERVYAVQATEKALIAKISQLAKDSEEAMQMKRLKTKKAEYKAAWVTNLYFLKTDLLPASQKGYNDCFKQLWEIAKDAWEYSLTSEELDDKVQTCKKMCDAITGGVPIKGNYNGNFKASDIIQVGNGNDWLNSKGNVGATVNPAEDKAELRADAYDSDSDSDGY